MSTIALVIGAIVCATFGLVVYSLLHAASGADDALEEAMAAAPSFEQLPVESAASKAVSTALLVGLFVAVFIAAQLLDGPSAMQAEQDIGDEVAALTGKSQTQASPAVRPLHATTAQATRRHHVSVIADAR